MKWSRNERDMPGNNMADDTNEVNRRESYLRDGGTVGKSHELYEKNALGNIASQYILIMENFSPSRGEQIMNSTKCCQCS